MTIASHTAHIPLRVYRSVDRVTVAAPMPGLEPEDIRVEVTLDRRLCIEGAPADAEPDMRALKSNKSVLLDEWSDGPYRREFGLSEPVDANAATLTYGNGILVVALPLSA